MNEALMKEYEKTFMDKVTVIHAAFDEKPHTVAFVMVDKNLSDLEKCEEAFMKTNTIDDAWWVNDGVEYVGPEPTCRSTATDDFVLVGKTKYKCSRIGWEKV